MKSSKKVIGLHEDSNFGFENLFTIFVKLFIQITYFTSVKFTQLLYKESFILAQAPTYSEVSHSAQTNLMTISHFTLTRESHFQSQHRTQFHYYLL